MAEIGSSYFIKLLLASSLYGLSFVNNSLEGIIGSMILSPL